MVKENWTFEDAVANIETLKDYYNSLLVSFSYFERKKRIKLCRDFKTQVYSLHIEEYKLNRIWRYINNEIEYEDLVC